ALFNRATVPALQRRLAHLDRRTRLTEWTFWKIMLHHTDAGYLAQPPRRPIPVPTRPAHRHDAPRSADARDHELEVAS
ncbi:MAG: hypothetical protein ACXWA3_18475, partial [Acidimicrobiales bacterium]